MQLIQNLWRFVRDLVFWFLEGWRFWLPPLTAVLVLIVSSRLPPSQADPLLRFWGLAFQLFGIYTVVVGLIGKRRLFNRPSLFEYFRRWEGRRPRWVVKKPEPISLSVADSASMSGIASPSLWQSVPAQASVEDRLAVLEVNFKTLKTKQEETAKELWEATRKTNETLGAEQRSRESAVTALREQLEELGVGGLRIEMMGVVWLVLGIILATVPNEITSVLRWFQ